MVSSGDVKTLYLVCDTSGSMGENGKNMLMRSMVRAVEQYIRFNYGQADLQLINWNVTAQLQAWNPDDEYPESLLECAGSASMCSLQELLAEAKDCKILILTDGYWSTEDDTIFKRWKRLVPPDTIHLITLGGDANPLQKGKDVFTSDNFFGAMDSWLPNGASNEAKGEEDEW